MALWERNPPSSRRVLLTIGLVLVLLVVWGLEQAGLWPGALTAERMHR
ncbi:hypothetical protein [uncultured Roseobacter sp.]|nr:hypothetical protein [uncultured Roseobacter sp.]